MGYVNLILAMEIVLEVIYADIVTQMINKKEKYE